MSQYPKKQGGLQPFWLLVLVALGALLMPLIVESAEEQAKIQGIVFISPSGKLEGDLVMRAAGVEVMLVRGEGTFEAQLQALRQSRSPTIDKRLQAVTRAQQEFLRSAGAPREEQEKKSAILRQERADLTELRAAYENDVNELIAKHTMVKTRTDSEGKFAFSGITRGRYFVYTRFEIPAMGIHYYWLLPVELKGEKEIDISLDKLNAAGLL